MKPKVLQIGVISSSGGSAFSQLYRISKNASFQCNWFVVTDRDCGIARFCEEQGIRHLRISESDNEDFSKQAANFFETQAPLDAVFLYFSRLITGQLFDRYPCVNFHPSLLPEYAGFGAVKRAWKAQRTNLGATAHLVNESIDAGPILSQVCHPLPNQKNQATLEKISFLQKVYLGLWVLEQLAESGKLANPSPCPPTLSHAGLRQGMSQLAIVEGYPQLF